MNAVAAPQSALTSSSSLLYLTIFVLSFVDFLQSGMTAFAAGPIMGEVGITPEDFSLIAAAYAAVAILMISMQRWFVERFGGRHFIQTALAVLMVGDVMCAISSDFASFLAGRVVMAIGGGALFTSSRMIIHHCLAGPKRFAGIKALASSVALGIASAPWLAANVVAHETWSAIYWLLASIAAAAFVMAGITLPREPLLSRDHQRAVPDPLQQFLLVGGSFILLYALQRLYYDYYGERARTLVLLAGAVFALLVYARRQHTLAKPLLAIRYMLHPRYVAGVLLFMVGYLMLGANNYVVPVMLQRTLGFSWETVGHFQALGFLFALLTWLVMSRVVPRRPSPRKFLVVGFAALAGFGWFMGQLTLSADLWWHVLPALALYSVFLLTVLPTAAMQTFRELEFDEAVFSNGQQLKNMLAQAGIALGIALATLGQQWRTAVHYTALNGQIATSNAQFVEFVLHLRESLSPSIGDGPATRLATARVAQVLAQQASLLANIDHFRVLAVVGLAGVIVTLVQKVLR